MIKKGTASFYSGLFFMSCIVLASCNQQKATEEERVSEVEFRVDSSYFDYAITDSFYTLSMPHLSGWKRDTFQQEGLEDPVIIVSHDTIRLALIFSSHEARQPNSYRFYTEAVEAGQFKDEVLDLSNFLKDGTRLTQMIIRNEEQVVFKLAYDQTEKTTELNIYIDKNQYNEKNILLTESIIGQINFITK